MLCKHQVIGSIPIGSTSVQALVVQIYPGMKTQDPVIRPVARNAHFFDIVNGFFKIDAVVHRSIFAFAALSDDVLQINLAERKLHRPTLLLVVWILKREVRAFGGCLGMYRR